MGDSYANDSKWGGSTGGKHVSQLHGDNPTRHRTKTGLKSKDLIGMPWRVALALQEPYYTGRIKSKEDRIWLAALVDTEGCIFIHKRKKGQSNGQGYFRKHDSYGAGLEIANCSRAIIERCKKIAGIGSICEQGPNQNARRKQIIYRWNVRSNECRWILKELYPHLVRKQNEARLAIGCPSSGEKAAIAHTSLIAIHRGQKPKIDFPMPDSMFEQGWWLRSSIIFSKKNPMPESVTDRPTSAHEHIFLLTKAAKYFYDAEAVREGRTQDEDAKTFRGGSYVEGSPGPRKVTGNKRVRKQDALGKQTYTGFNDRYRENPVYGRNQRNVWTIATQPYPKAHFATFPEEIPRRVILAGTSARGCCLDCGAPWERVVEKDESSHDSEIAGKYSKGDRQGAGARIAQARDSHRARGHGHDGYFKSPSTTGWRSTCEHPRDPTPCTVLDPFAGSGTVGKVATEMGREYILIELSEEYVPMIEERTATTIGLGLGL